MNFSLKLSLAVIILSGIPVGCANAQTVAGKDLSTDKAVIAEMQKIVDAKSAEISKDDEKLEAKRKAASKLEAKDICIERLKESTKIIVIGFFRYDYGCHFEGAFINSRYFAADDADLSKTALAALGWEKALKKERERLANLWVTKGLLAFSKVLYTKDKDFNGSEFQPPQVVSKENGETVVTLWISFVRRKKEFGFVEYRFAKDGSDIW